MKYREIATYLKDLTPSELEVQIQLICEEITQEYGKVNQEKMRELQKQLRVYEDLYAIKQKPYELNYVGLKPNGF
jgi:hypothetical protein